MSTLILIAIYIYIILLLVLSIYLIHASVLSVPFYPSSVKRFKKAMLEMNIEFNNKKFIDLGSGDGRILIQASKLGAIPTGIEFNPYISLLSKLFIFIIGLSKKIKVFNKNFFNINFSEYDVVYTFLLSDHMEKLKNKLINEMKEGSIIISNTFKLKGVEPIALSDKFYIYKITKELKNKFNNNGA